MTHALRLMNQTSVLGRYLWVFRRIVGRMQHDLFHVYTVDQHILMVLRNVRRFFIPEHAHEYPFCSQLASQWDEPWLLYVAALFHDVAKGRGGDHSRARRARSAPLLPRPRRRAARTPQLIEFLVLHHLTMSRIAQKEDLQRRRRHRRLRPAGGHASERLTALYLLTVADIRGTSPRVWNAWKGKLLEDLYRLTLRALGGSRPNLDAEIENRKTGCAAASSRCTRRCPAPRRRCGRRWTSATSHATTRPTSPGMRARCGATCRSNAPVVRARLSSVGDGLQVLVFSPDRADLFARICGYFDGAGIQHPGRQGPHHPAGYALDTFQVVSTVLGPDTGPADYRNLISLVETQAAAALASEGPLPDPARGRVSRRVRSFPVVPRVSLAPDDRAQRWLLSVSASDRSGLLYAIARVLARHRVNLQLAKISTLGERVEDTFLVDGPALQQPKAQLRIESELLDASGRRPAGAMSVRRIDAGRSRRQARGLRRGHRCAQRIRACAGPSAARHQLADPERHAAPRRSAREYQQVSAFEARKRGAAMAARNIAAHLEREAAQLPRSWRPLVYCWRGGQRSGVARADARPDRLRRQRARRRLPRLPPRW